MRIVKIVSVCFMFFVMIALAGLASALVMTNIEGVEDNGIYKDAVTITPVFDEVDTAAIQITHNGQTILDKKSTDEGCSVEQIRALRPKLSDDGKYVVTLTTGIKHEIPKPDPQEEGSGEEDSGDGNSNIDPELQQILDEASGEESGNGEGDGEVEGGEPAEPEYEIIETTVKKQFLIDTEKPTADVMITGPTYGTTEWHYADVSINAVASDSSSGLKSLTVSFNGKELYKGAGSQFSTTLQKEDLIKEHAPNGEFIVTATAEDVAGNTMTKMATFLFDGVAPEVSFSGIGDNAIINKVGTVTLTATDNVKPDKVTMLVKKGGQVVSLRTEEGSTISFTPTEDGSYEISGYAVDAAGNQSTEAITHFKLDRVDPTITNFTHVGTRVSEDAWYNGAVGIEALIADDFSGLDTSVLEVNGRTIAREEYSGQSDKQISETLSRDWFLDNESENGKYEATLAIKDIAGNSASKEISFRADVVTPSVKVSGIEEGTFTSSKPEISVKVTDNYPGMNTIYMTIERDGALYKSKTFEDTASASFSGFDKDGNYTVTAWSVDKAGNTSKKESLSFTRDTTAPVITLSGAKEGSYYNVTKAITANIKELNYKGVKVSTKVTKTLDSSNEGLSWSIVPTSADFNSVKKFPGTGTYSITVEAVDKAGNKATPKSLSFTVDTVKPEIKITGIRKAVGYDDGISPKVEYKEDYFDKSDISLAFSGGKASASFKDTKNKHGGTRQYSGFAKTKENDGTYTIKCTVTDKAGNSASKSEVFKINRFGSWYKISDSAKELQGKIVKEVDTGFAVTEENVTGLTEKKPKIMLDGETLKDAKISIEETNSGNYKYNYRFNKENFDKEGSYICSVSSTDTIGNFSELPAKKQVKFTVDKTAPVITVSGVSEGESYKDGKGLLKVSVSDNFATDKFNVLINNEQVFESQKDEDSATVDVPKGINQDIRVVAYDKAGNKSVESIKNITVSEGSPLGGGGLGKILPIAAVLAALGAAALVFLLRRGKVS